MHLPFLPAILSAFPSLDILVGKLQPTAAIRRFFETLAPADRTAAAARVRFLVDSRARLDELVALAADQSLTLQVGVEIDVGLHRGGVRRPSALPDVLAGFVANPNALRFVGMLGYDGHLTADPNAPGLDEYAVRQAYRGVVDTYNSFLDVLRSSFPSLVRDDLVFNSGGTETYALHHGGPANDVAAGGGMLRPASYSNLFISALKPAVFIASPVLAHFDKVELPFVPEESGILLDGNQSFSMYGGGWAAVPVWPDGVDYAPIEAGPENQNLVPNQSLLVAPSSPPINPGDWIFHYPRQSDAIFQFESLLLVRGGRLQTNSWRAFPRRY
jgi:D-serine deaminase-like pyridoxal phosphate-dependent protein